MIQRNKLLDNYYFIKLKIMSLIYNKTNLFCCGLNVFLKSTLKVFVERELYSLHLNLTNDL